MLGAIVAGIGSLIGGAASGVVGLGSGLLSGVGSLASGAFSGIGGLFAPTAATALTQTEIAAMQAGGAAPWTGALAAKGGADVLGGVAAATGPTLDYLSEILGKGMGIYQVFKPPKEPGPAAGAPTIYTTAPSAVPQLPLQLLGTQQTAAPMIMTTPAPAAPATPNYLIYAIIAVIAILLIRKK